MITKSERTKSLEETQIDPDEDLMTRGIRSGIKGAALVASRVGDVAATGADMAAKYLNKSKKQTKMSQQEADELEQEKRRESRGLAVKEPPLFEKLSTDKKPQNKRAGGVVGSASKRADGIAQRGKTRGRMV